MQSAIRNRESFAPELPARGFRESLLFQTNDLDEARDKVASVYRPHVLDFKRRPKQLDTSFFHIPLAAGSINWLGYGSDMVINPGELEDFFLVQTPTQGGGDVVCGKQHIQTTARRSSVLNPTEAVKLIWDADCWKIQVQLDRNLTERCLSNLLERPLHEPIIFKLAMDMETEAGRAWSKTVRFVTEEVPLLRALPNCEPMVRQIEQMLVNTLLHVQPHNYTEELLNKAPNIAPRHVKIAEDYMVEHCRENVTIDELVRIAGVSARTLYKGFQQFRGLSPMRFLKTTRLDKAHEALKEASRSSCVTEIAMEFGFRQLGRFAVEYRQRFGESPSDTLKR